MYTELLTFHTSSLAWIITPHSSINASYRVSLDKISSNGSESLNTSYYTVPIDIDFSSGGDSVTFRLQFADLVEDTSYGYGVSIVGDDKTIANAAQGSFQTATYRKCEMLGHRVSEVIIVGTN